MKREVTFMYETDEHTPVRLTAVLHVNAFGCATVVDEVWAGGANITQFIGPEDYDSIEVQAIETDIEEQRGIADLECIKRREG